MPDNGLQPGSGTVETRLLRARPNAAVSGCWCRNSDGRHAALARFPPRAGLAPLVGRGHNRAAQRPGPVPPDHRLGTPPTTRPPTETVPATAETTTTTTAISRRCRLLPVRHALRWTSGAYMILYNIIIFSVFLLFIITFLPDIISYPLQKSKTPTHVHVCATHFIVHVARMT